MPPKQIPQRALDKLRDGYLPIDQQVEVHNPQETVYQLWVPDDASAELRVPAVDCKRAVERFAGEGDLPASINAIPDATILAITFQGVAEWSNTRQIPEATKDAIRAELAKALDLTDARLLAEAKAAAIALGLTAPAARAAAVVAVNGLATPEVRRMGAFLPGPIMPDDAAGAATAR